MVLLTVETTDGSEWVAEFPDLPGCCGGGQTAEEAVVDANDNKEAYIRALVEDGLPIYEVRNF